ncbi:hypothetical protein DXX93_02760 [Thalassotalea euphylliae]|uniref:Uncharacterized protein n=1 Tax=Thalassotalea euphylliae TaxID=1655234 RepID=A0A3E0TLZ6_9GAMM|nr:hypothetical protein [Thalassotalea euphylliae]REL25574.1 hypothetical protein DXX93_02760 [Thalassotalea euphylliae]
MKLPIRIAAEQQVSDALNITKHDLERIEAWANFETLKANWYGDEAHSPSCQLTLVSPQYFNAKFLPESALPKTLPETLSKNTQEHLVGWQLDDDQTAAIKYGELGSKHLIVISVDDNQLNVLMAKVSQNSPPSEWIGSDNAVKLQQVIRHWLLHLAKHFDLDPID